MRKRARVEALLSGKVLRLLFQMTLVSIGYHSSEIAASGGDFSCCGEAHFLP